jgi:hypothetical protein
MWVKNLPIHEKFKYPQINAIQSPCKSSVSKNICILKRWWRGSVFVVVYVTRLFRCEVRTTRFCPTRRHHSNSLAGWGITVSINCKVYTRITKATMYFVKYLPCRNMFKMEVIDCSNICVLVLYIKCTFHRLDRWLSLGQPDSNARHRALSGFGHACVCSVVHVEAEYNEPIWDSLYLTCIRRQNGL